MHIKLFGRLFAYLVILVIAFTAKTESLDVVTQPAHNSEFLAVSANVTIDAPIQNVLPFFHGGNACWQWQLRCKSSKVLAKLNSRHQIVYTVINMPWPLSDRDLIFDVAVKGATATGTGLILDSNENSFDENKENNPVLISLKPYSGELEQLVQNEKLVRAMSTIDYSLSPISEHQTQLSIYMHTEFGGSVSPSMINTRLEKSVRQDINALLQLINKKTRPPS